MAQVEPLYDFPEPTQSLERKLPGPPKGRGSLRSVSILDRLLLTVPVWLQLSINPATALHILQKEPPGSFLVRKSRTSQRNVLCVRLADDSVPSFVQQFGIREEQSSKTLCLETSTISFPDLPRLISFYCVSRDVLRFPLELPEAIAKATSHKELESISHMGIEFWNSHLNVRGPREAPKPQRDEEKKPDAVTSVTPAAPPQTASAPPPDSDNQLQTATRPGTDDKRAGSNPTLFHEFCPITTRSPRELDYGSGQGALCFINPLFLQSQNSLCRRRMFTRSLKVRISTESSSLLSPPLAAPPPPPLMPKAKRNRNAPKLAKGTAHPSKGQARAETPDEVAQIHTVQFGMENLPEDSDYMQPSPMISISNLPPLSPSLSPYACPMAPPLFPKASRSLSPYGSPGASPSPYQSPSLSPYASPSASPSLSPYQSPSPSPKVVPFCLSPFISPPSFLPLAEQAYHTPATPSRPDQRRSEREAEEEDEGAGADVIKEEEDTKEEPHTKREEEEGGLVLQMNASSLKDTERCSGLEGAAETSSAQQDNAASL